MVSWRESYFKEAVIELFVDYLPNCGFRQPGLSRTLTLYCKDDVKRATKLRSKEIFSTAFFNLGVVSAYNAAATAGRIISGVWSGLSFYYDEGVMSSTYILLEI